ncbi:MAG: pilin [Clostridium sp.]
MLFLNAGGAIDFGNVATPITTIINAVKGPAINIVIALAAIYCIILGAKFAKAEEPQEREKAKGALKNAVIGFVLIFVLLVALDQLSPLLMRWAGVSGK